jgi:hypothetical protein
MSRLLLASAASIAVVLAAAAGLSLRGAEVGVLQPIAFDHARHQQEDIACLDCHKNAETSPYATLPKIATCLLCHAEPKGENPEEKKVREYADKNAQIPWVQVNRLPGHVYFSHAAHVKLGKMECAVCHGDMGTRKEPVTSSQVEHLTMGRCMQCHTEKGASNDCLACHK